MLDEKTEEEKAEIGIKQPHLQRAAPCCPLVMTREQDDKDKKARDEPTNLTPEEMSFEEEYYRKTAGKIPKEQIELMSSLTQSELAMLAIITLKHVFNSMKVFYKADLENQRKSWEECKTKIALVEGEEWFKGLTPEQKKACIAEQWGHVFHLLSVQNAMLEGWGSRITIIGRLLEEDFMYRRSIGNAVPAACNK